ncbi:MAG: hypothetical protein E6G85_16100 [Alphaproteobacteria bacterium]|nr:MAG: hypothetical protein E6G85_16100 [Alphaproteobacteria bacterium]
MVDDRPEDVGSPPDPGRAKRAPPTIDLKATEVSGETKNAAADAPVEPAPQDSRNQGSSHGGSSEGATSGGESSERPKAAASAARSPSISPWVIAPMSGAVAAALVITVGWMLGWPQVQVAPAGPQVSASAIDDLAGRVAGLESKVGKPGTDSAAAARFDALEKSLAALRGDLASLRTQSQKLAADVGNARAVPGESVAALDLTALNERISQIERLSRTQSAEIAREGEKIAESKPADDVPLRRVVAAALLDVAVQQGHPFPEVLAAAKSLAPNPDALKPLDSFAATGVPNPPLLSRELLTLVPKLSPPAETSTSGSGIVDRLQAGASRLVRVERTDATGNDRGAIVGRVTQAALRNDLADARRELNALSQADRAPAQAWLDKADARDAALAASRQFATEAMTALAKPSQ